MCIHVHECMGASGGDCRCMWKLEDNIKRWPLVPYTLSFVCMHASLVLGQRNSHIPGDHRSATGANGLALGLVRDIFLENKIWSDRGGHSASTSGLHTCSHMQKHVHTCNAQAHTTWN